MMEKDRPVMLGELIAQLQSVMLEHSDLPLTTFDGFITEVIVTPATDGVINAPNDEPNEFYVDVISVTTIYD